MHHRHSHPKGVRAPQFVCITLGTMIMCLLLMQPFWNSILMLHNPVFSYFVGKQVPGFIIAACLCLIVLYILTIVLFFRHSRKAAQSEQNILMITNVYATSLGALVLLISMPVRRIGLAVAEEILDKCQHGQGTHDLYATYTELLELRKSPRCAMVNSTEFCEGFQRSSNSDLLKAMEFRYECSGWCSPPTPMRALMPLPAPPPRIGGVSLMQLDIQKESRKVTQDSSQARGELDRPIHPETRAHIALTGANAEYPALIQATGGLPAGGVKPQYVYPPTLFSRSNFQATCNGLSARDAQYFLGDTADELYYEGLYLMVISVGIGFLKLLGFCMKDNIFSQMKRGGYGSSDYQSSAVQRLRSEASGKAEAGGA